MIKLESLVDSPYHMLYGVVGLQGAVVADYGVKRKPWVKQLKTAFQVTK